jgi:hypothetical protein
MKENVFKLKIEHAANNKTGPFSETELDRAIKVTNRGRVRDPEGLISEIFPFMVLDHKMSLLLLFNELKSKG